MKPQNEKGGAGGREGEGGGRETEPGGRLELESAPNRSSVSALLIIYPHCNFS